jgi:hypothetical protein
VDTFINLPVISTKLGVELSPSPGRYFVRRDTGALISQLTETQSQLLHFIVTGPPGIGKSSALWAYACSQATFEPVLYIKLSPIGGSTIFRFRPRDDHSGFVIELCGIEALESFAGDIMIVDGVRSTPTPHTQQLVDIAVKWQRYASTEKQLIFVSSMQYALPNDDTPSILRARRWISFEPWTLESYHKACEDDTFWASVAPMLDEDPGQDATDEPNERRRRVCAKYRIAGGSARLMFGVDTAHAIAFIDIGVGALNDAAAVVKGLTGDGSNAAVNRIYTRKFGFVSDYALRQVVSKLDQACMCFLTNFSQTENNGSLDGQVLEIDFLFQIKQALTHKSSLSLKDHNHNVALPLPVLKTYQYDDKRLDAVRAEIVRDGVLNSFWLLPKSRIQGCFDALFIRKDGLTWRLLVLQVTRALKHDFKLAYCIPPLKMLQAAGLHFGPNSVQVVAILPDDHPRLPTGGFNFKPGSITSDKCVALQPVLDLTIPRHILGIVRTTTPLV